MIIWSTRTSVGNSGFSISSSEVSTATTVRYYYWWYQGITTYVYKYEEMAERVEFVVKSLNSGIYSGISDVEFCKEILDQ